MYVSWAQLGAVGAQLAARLGAVGRSWARLVLHRCINVIECILLLLFDTLYIFFNTLYILLLHLIFYY